MKRLVLLLLCGLALVPGVAAARDQCPFLRDPAYWARAPVAPAAPGELGIGTLNVYRLFDDEQDGSERTRLTSAEFAARTARIARYIAHDMGAPSAVGLQELEDDTAAAALAAQLSRETGRTYQYLVGDKDADSDIRNGLLLDARLTVLRHYALFASHPFEKGPRFDRLPLVVDIDAGAAWPGIGRITLAVVHLKSQIGIDRGAEAGRVLAKRRFQATQLANWVRAQQQAGTRLLLLGDYNAPVIDPDPARAEPMHILLADGGLVDVAGRFLKPSQRWTYRYHCSVQELDHLLPGGNLAPAVRGYAIARGDTCLRARETCSGTHSVSDHEGVVLRLGR